MLYKNLNMYEPWYSPQAQTGACNIIYLCLEVIEDGKLLVVSNIWVWIRIQNIQIPILWYVTWFSPSSWILFPPPLPRRMILPTRYVSLRNVGRRNESTISCEISAFSNFDPLELFFRPVFYIFGKILVSFTKPIPYFVCRTHMRDAI